jgi:hypothetical protein
MCTLGLKTGVRCRSNSSCGLPAFVAPLLVTTGQKVAATTLLQQHSRAVLSKFSTCLGFWLAAAGVTTDCIAAAAAARAPGALASVSLRLACGVRTC